MLKVIKGIVAGAILLSLSGCAAMFNGASEQAFIRSNDSDAKIYVNEAYVGKGNAVAVLKKKENYTIRVEKEGCSSTTYPVSKSFDATTLLGILIDFGVVTILLVDGLATGAWQNFDQTSFIVDPNC